MFLRSIIQQFSSYSYSTQKHQEVEAKLDGQRQNEKEKVSDPFNENNTNQKKGSVPQN